MARPKEDVQERFWRYVKKTTKCWLWIGSKIPQGYGQFMIEGKNLKAHRVSYMLFKGKIPKGRLICHRCDNPPCVNPEHLFIGTWKSNSDDMIRKNRKYDTSGENNGQSKITKKIADEIRKKYSENKETNPYLEKKFSQNKLAKKYGLSQTAVGKIIRGKMWV